MKHSIKLLISMAVVGVIAVSVNGNSRPEATAAVASTTANADTRETASVTTMANSADTDARPEPGVAPELLMGPDFLPIATAAPVEGATMQQRQADESGARPSDDVNKTSPRDKMSGSVAALAAAGGSQLVDIVVRYDQHPELFDDEVVAQLGGKVVRGYNAFEMRAIQLPADALEDLAVEENVDWLSLDNAVASLSVASRVAANIPAGSSVNTAFDGQDIGIAIIDTGISRHSDLAENFLQYSFLYGAYPTPTISNGVIAAYNDSPRDDRFGHGTHVAGIITGAGTDSSGNYEGSAKGAKLLALQVLDHKGGGQMSDVLAALDWLYQFGSYFDIRVVNLSLGMSIGESNTTDPMVLAVERLWDAGIVVVVAAGNEGFHGNMSITSPGNSRKVITVGSLTDGGTGNDATDDFVSSFSSRGPTVGDYVMKPDLVAPGNRLVAAVPQNSKLAIDLPSRIIACTVQPCSGNYLELSGTSMAAPMVTAAVARMLQKDPGISPATVKARLMRSARKIDDEPTAVGAGVLDIEAALNDAGIVTGEALSPLMVRDDASGGIFVEDTADLWGDPVWAAGYLFNGGFDWADGYSYSDSNTVTANGYLWTDGDVWAKGYLWTDGDVWAKGYLWTDGDGVGAKSLLEGSEDTGFIINDD